MARRAGLAAAIWLLWAGACTAADTHMRIGVLAYRGEERALSAWTPTATYLSEKIPGHRFTVVPYDLAGLRAAIRERQVDFILTNTGHYVELEADYGVSRIATLKNVHENHTYTVFGAAVISRANREDIRGLDDLRGKSFMAVDRNAFGGFRMAWGEFKRHGIDPFRDFSELRFSGFPQDLVVYAVVNGEVDAGTVRAHTLQRMAREGRIRLDDFRVLNAQSSEIFPFPHSTRLYPEWPFARLKDTSAELSEEVAIALLQLSSEHPATQAARIAGWTVPMDYQPVHRLYRELHVGPYARIYTLREFIHEYAYVIVLVGAVIVLLGVVTTTVLRLDRKVRRSQASLARAQKIAHLGNWEWDVQRNTLKCSGEIYKIFGIEQDRPVDFETFTRIIHPNDREAVKQAINDALYHSKLLNIDHRILTPDGALRIVNEQGEVELDEQGIAVSMTATVQDITERKLAEERIRASEREVSAILHNMQDTFFRVSPKGIFLFVSPSVQELLGYAPEELKGQSIGRLLEAGSDRARFIQELRSGRGYVSGFETRLSDKKGLGVSVSINAHYYYDQDGDVAGVEGTVRDVSKLKRAEEALYKQKERMQVTLRSIGDGVISTDVTGAVDYMNPSAEELTGWSTGEARGTELFRVFDLVDAGRRETMEQRFSQTLDGVFREPYVSHDTTIQRADGHQRVVEVTLTPIRDYEDNVIGVVLVFHDVTELRARAAESHAYGGGRGRSM